MQLASLQDMLVKELQDLYSAETQITEALPKMAQAVTTPELRSAFQEHLRVTENQIKRLERAFNLLGENAEGKECKGMKGLLKEGDELLTQKGDPNVLEAGMIAAAQKVEHYEMAGYGSARTWARIMGQQEVANLLQQSLDEEGQTDHKLTQIAENMVNVMAVEA